jgi:D-amino peptidase
MKIYISFDIEGVSGITDISDTDVESPNFSKARTLSTRDVNAAIEGALAGGATDIVVYDGHGWGRRNLLHEGLHPKAKLLKGRVSTEWLNMAGFFSDSFDAVFFIGWHARPSSPGILSHCLNSRVFTAWRVNGTLVGEPELAAALAGQHNVPLVLFTGDDCSCKEVKSWCPDCECVVTKYALDRFSAICLSKETTYELIREGAERALKRKDEIKPFRFKMPVRVEADTLFDHTARAIALIPGVEQISPLTVAFESDNYVEAFRTIQATQLISGAAQ